MATIRKKRIKGKDYFYLEHRYHAGGKLKSVNTYLGTELPDNKDALLEKTDLEALREQHLPLFKSIQKGYLHESKTLPKTAKDKLLGQFMVEFIFNSNKIEGSTLSYKDTVGLFVHNVAPKNKPLKDVKEAEGYGESFRSMQKTPSLTLKLIMEWHRMIFKDTDPAIAGKIRLHKIMVTGSSASFPHPEDVLKLMKEFVQWHARNRKRLFPVEFAALVHLKFVSIHPFSDGNGRMSRLLMNHALYHGNFPLFNIKHTERMGYYKALEKSQTWRTDKDFLRFFFKKYASYHKKYSGKDLNKKH